MQCHIGYLYPYLKYIIRIEQYSIISDNISACLYRELSDINHSALVNSVHIQCCNITTLNLGLSASISTLVKHMRAVNFYTNIIVYLAVLKYIKAAQAFQNFEENIVVPHA